MSTPRMLIADDNPLSLRFLSEAVALLGYEHVTAEDGTHALTAAQREPFDLLLLDALMPELGGADVLRLVRANAGPSQQSVALATTAGNDPDTRTSLLAAGFEDVLLKPLSIDTLRRAITRHIPTSTAHPGPAALGGEVGAMELDELQALAAAGGDPSIVTALREMLRAELDALPEELVAMAAKQNADALRDRLHRLDASAGFCGVPVLKRAASTLRGALDAARWPDAAIAEFLSACAQIRRLLT